ncbi:MAG: hypothetical protein IAG13_23045, partial [Deltaproteobacteria bacterium]|nr:hypothetical protein [Nannocystaceae bacterium]
LDTAARALADRGKETLGVIVVENRPGAGGEAPRRTLTRASERLVELERDLDNLQRHADPEHPEVISELTDAATLLTETRNAVATASVSETVEPARLDDVVALVEASQQRLHTVRQQRVATHAM